MSFQFCRRKFYFLLALALPGYAAVHPVQHSAREQVNAQVLNAASQKIESLAQQRRWHDYRYTFKVYIPSQIATAAPCTKTPGVTLTSPGDIALNRMNFTVSCPQKLADERSGAPGCTGASSNGEVTGCPRYAAHRE